MTTENPNPAIAQLEADIQRAVEQGLDLQERVQQLTLSHIGAGRFDLAALRELSQAVLKGALAGAQPLLSSARLQGGPARAAMAQVVAGLDAALARLAQTASLALQEAAAQARSHSESELAQARADLGRLESMYLDTLQAAAASARDMAGQIMSELAEHARRNGSAVGAQLHETLAGGARQLGEIGRAQLSTGLQAAQVGGDLLRQIAAGVLGALAEQVKPPRKENQSDKKS
jgi:hypothetical protein